MEKRHRQGTFRDHLEAQESLGSVQKPQGWEGTQSSQGAQGHGELSTRALLQGRLAHEEHGLNAAQCSPREEQLLLTSFSLLPSFKAEVNCSCCPRAAGTGDTTFTKQYPLAAAAAVRSLVLRFHSLLIPLLSLQMS